MLRPPEGAARAADDQPRGHRGVRPVRRRRRDRAVELSGAHSDGLDRLRAGRGQRRRVQAQRVHARHRSLAWSTPSTEVVPEHPVLQVVTGFGATGAGALPRRASTRSRSPARPRPAGRSWPPARETLTPVLIECGGKDALIVAADADLVSRRRRAPCGVDGQRRADLRRRRAGVRRGRGLRRVRAPGGRAGRELRPGSETDASYGPMTMPAQLDVIAAHLADAPGPTAAGRYSAGPNRVRPPFVAPWCSSTCPRTRSRSPRRRSGRRSRSPGCRDVDEAVERVNASRLRPRRRGLQRATGPRDRGATGHAAWSRSTRCSPSR